MHIHVKDNEAFAAAGSILNKAAVDAHQAELFAGHALVLCSEAGCYDGQDILQLEEGFLFSIQPPAITEHER